MVNLATNPRSAPTLSLPFIGLSLLLALIVLVGANLWMFLGYYGDTLTPLPLPYTENFETLQRLDYRQFGGNWQLRDHQLIQTDSQDTDLLAVIPLTVAPDQSYQFGVHLSILQGPNGGGLMFNLQHQDSRQQSHLVRFGNDNGQDYLVFGYFDENFQFVAQGSISPPALATGVDLAVQVQAKTYTIFVNGQPVQQQIPLHYSGGHLALTTWFSSVAFDDVAVNSLPARAENASGPAQLVVPETVNAVVTDTTPIVATAANATPAENLFFSEQFNAESDQTLWTSLSGDWRFEADALVQQNPDGFDYSIVRSGTFARYTISVRLRHRQGIGGGLLFNMPNEKSKTHGHLVRYFADGGMAWGYFTEDDIFTGQGYTPTELPGAEAHTLQVIVSDSTYSILLDKQIIAENIPLFSQQGHIGLTASQSIVSFEEITITANE